MEKIKDFADYDQYVTEPDYTTSAQAQDYFRNQNGCLKDVVANYWQPETDYSFGDEVFAANLPKYAVAVCVKTGKSSTVEPSWGDVGGSKISDGTIYWQVQYRDGVKNGLTIGSARERANKPTYGL